jgi:CelD/BcsL family acetyltransferase involved in cellulose biosynthesis
MRTALLDPLTDAAWLRLLDRAAADATVFHHPAWLGLVRDHYRFPTAAVCVLGDDGEPVAGLPLVAIFSRLTGRRLVAVPFSDTCGPLVAPGAPDGTLELLARAVEAERSRRGSRLEVHERFDEAGTAVELFHRHVVDLREGPDALETSWASRVRRNIRKGRREGVVSTRETGGDALDVFYALHLQTRHRLGVPTQPKAFIRRLKAVFERGMGFVGVARHDGRPIAAAVFLVAGTKVLYKYGASDQTALALRPNNILFADVLRWAAEEGHTELDLGRTDLGQEGLREFKRSWGAEEIPLAYTYAGTAAPEPGHGRTDQALAAVITRTPPVAGRVIGELLYRHAG